jgi:hypothetical protein
MWPRGVQAAGRLVEDEEVGVVEERLSQTGALLHALGVSLDLALPRVVQFDQFQHSINRPLRFRSGNLENAGVEPEQFLRGKELVVTSLLGEIADALAGDRLAHVHGEDAGRAAGGRNKPQQDVHRGGLARAIGAEKAEDFALADAQVQRTNRDLRGLTKIAAAVFNAQVLN